MEPVRSLKNQYWGINAHLHSYWQNDDGWNDFHTNHIADLTQLMQEWLYPIGYTACEAPSLQIRRLGRRLRTRFHHQAVGVYPAENPGANARPVIWLELLCPSNKPGGQDWAGYQQRRDELLHNEILIVELDYLHETPSTIYRVMPNYSVKGIMASPDTNASAYHVLMFNPDPSYGEGTVNCKYIEVDETVPVIRIPVNREQVLLDLGAAYRKTFEEMLYGNQVDYRSFPVHFERYSETDQARVASWMLAVLKAERAGVNLEEHAPVEMELLTLADALSELKAFGV